MAFDIVQGNACNPLNKSYQRVTIVGFPRDKPAVLDLY